MKTAAKYQFTLKTLLFTTFCVALLLGTFRFVGHYIVFGMSTLVVAASTWRLFHRKTTLRKRISWGTCLVISLLLFYVLSIGPASWLLARYNTPDHPRPETFDLYGRIYVPVASAIIFSPPLLRRAGMWYIKKGMPSGTRFHDDWPRGMGWTMMSRTDPTRGVTFTVIHY